MKCSLTKILSVISMVFFIFCGFSMVKAADLTNTINVGHFPKGIVHDSKMGEIFVSNSGDNTVSVINESTNTVVATIPVGALPAGLAYDPDQNEIYVANSRDGTVSVISDTTNTVVATIPVGIWPYGIAYDSAHGEIYVTNSNYENAAQSGNPAFTCNISVISDESHTVTHTIDVGSAPVGIAYDSATREIYVSNSLSMTISVISNYEVKRTIDMEGYPIGGILYVNGEIVVPNPGGACVSFLSDIDYSVSRMNLGAYGVSPGGIAYNPSKGEIYVGADHLFVISDSSNSIIAEDNNTLSIFVYNPDNTLIYSANGGGSTVTVYTTSFEYTTPASNPSDPSNPTTPTDSNPSNPSDTTNPSTPSNTDTDGSTSKSASRIVFLGIIIVVIVLVVLVLLGVRKRRKAKN
jgi:YVTN family beta-propeller protein